MTTATGRLMRRRSSIGLIAAVTTALAGVTLPTTATEVEAEIAVNDAAEAVSESPTGRYFVSVTSTEDDASSLPNGATLQSVPEPAEAVAEFVETLESSPVADEVEVTSTHDTLWTGVVVDGDVNAAQQIAELPGVTRVYPVLPVQLTDDVAAPEQTQDADAPAAEADAAGVDAAGTDAYEAEQNTSPATSDGAIGGGDLAGEATTQAVDLNAGRGVRIAVIDSGIDIDHPSFGGSGRNGTTPFPNSILVGGWDFVENDGRPDDYCYGNANGHGTHVAGIAAGRPVSGHPSIVGVAPAAQLLIYRVFGCSELDSVGADVIISALETAYADRANVVNVSATILGMSWPDYPTAVAAQALVRNGVTVVSAQGNTSADPFRDRGPSLFGGGAPGVGDGVISVGAATGTALASYSEWGPTAQLDIRPDVLAPGNNVMHAFPLEVASTSGLWETKTGTSMATPVVSGQAAVLLSRNRNYTPAEVAARIVGTAAPVANGYGTAVPPSKQGGGIINLDASISTRLTTSPSRINLRETGSGTPRTQTITLSAGSNATYQVRHEPAASLETNSSGGTAASPKETSERSLQADVRLSNYQSSVTTSQSSSTSMKLTITPPTNSPAGVIYGGYVALVDSTGKVALRIPYQGMTGDFSELPFYAKPLSGGPELREMTTCDASNSYQCTGGLMPTPVSNDSTVFNMAGTNYPAIAYALAYPATDVSVTIERRTSSGKFYPLSVFALPLVEPQPAPITMRGRKETTIRWDGTYNTKLSSEPQIAPAGEYRMVFTANKPLASKPAQGGDITTWYSPTFTVRSGSPQWYLTSQLGPNADMTMHYGAPNDADVYVGDWDGDGVDGIAYRRGNVFYLRNDISSGVFDQEVAYGRATDKVYIGDWDGNGTDTFAVRRGNRFFFVNELRGGEADWTTDYGRAADEVVIGNWTGAKHDLPAVRRGNIFYFAHHFNGGEAAVVQAFGRVGDVVLPGDFDGDGTDTLGLRRGNHNYVKNDFKTGVADIDFGFGRVTDKPLVGTWTKGGKDTFGVHRPSR